MLISGFGCNTTGGDSVHAPTFGHIIAEARRQAGLSQKQLAGLEQDYLMLAAGRIPPDVRAIGMANPQMIEEAFRLFRQARE